NREERIQGGGRREEGTPQEMGQVGVQQRSAPRHEVHENVKWQGTEKGDEDKKKRGETLAYRNHQAPSNERGKGVGAKIHQRYGR
ncbi:hypothetical protein, partial [Salmonella enterica]|uniref:hypothetical protein n=1 Tax=Salmonella enterica TaxID=28901 RepID=UPI00398C6356